MGALVSRLELVPITLREANAFVLQHHRHHKPVRGCRFVVGCARPRVDEHPTQTKIRWERAA